MAVPAFADITVGLPADPGTGNCFPFGCAYSGEYQQVYSHTQFGASVKILDLEFFNTHIDTSATAMNSGTLTIYLSTKPADWNSISNFYANNLGADNTLVFSGNLTQPWAFGDTLHISLTTPFLYDPSMGNLLMNVVVSGASAPGGSIYFDTNGYNGGSFNANTYWVGSIAMAASRLGSLTMAMVWLLASPAPPSPALWRFWAQELLA